MTKTFVLLCGKPDSGKTTTIRKLFGMHPKQQFASMIINGKTVFACFTGSPQELSKFDADDTWENIKKRIAICDRESNDSKDYILVMPFTIRRNKEDCIREPIRKLKGKGQIKIIYLRRLDFADLLMEDLEGLKYREIKSVENGAVRQAGELRRFIESL